MQSRGIDLFPMTAGSTILMVVSTKDPPRVVLDSLGPPRKGIGQVRAMDNAALIGLDCLVRFAALGQVCFFQYGTIKT